jgi:hypothetical protein
MRHDLLGWDNFLEGRIRCTLFHLQESHFVKIGSQQKIPTWATLFIHHFLSIAHSQWLYRNTSIHIHLQECKTTVEHQIIKQVGDLTLLTSWHSSQPSAFWPSFTPWHHPKWWMHCKSLTRTFPSLWEAPCWTDNIGMLPRKVHSQLSIKHTLWINCDS